MTDAPASASSPAPADGAWQGAEKTMTDAPTPAPAPAAWSGAERTMTDAPAPAPATAPSAWQGAEKTMTDAPQPAPGVWSGAEHTMTDAPTQGDQARASDGPAIATAPGTGRFGSEQTLTDDTPRPPTSTHSDRLLADTVRNPPPLGAVGGRPADQALARLVHGQEQTLVTPPPEKRPKTEGSRGGTDYRPGTDTGTPSPSARVRAAKASRRKTETESWHLQGRPGPLTGQVFGDYELGGVLGEGGMGTIYRAWQYSLKRRVAVKTLSSAFAQDAVQRARFEMEARTASLIKSPHVVQVYGAGSYNDIAYFVMEFVEGVELGHLIAQKVNANERFTPDEAAGYVLQAAKGLAEAAGQNVVHRDIKPANMLIDKAGTLKIADFGISKISGENNLTRTGTAIGTPSYVSPEQGRGASVDARSDLYSLGVVFYELLVLKKPFDGTTANALIYQHNYAEPKLLRELDPTIPEAYQAVALKLMQKVPDKRYQSAIDLVRDLENLRAGNLSLTALIQAKYGTGADEMMRKYLGKQRRWVTYTVAALLVLAIGSVAALGYWMSTESGRKQALADLNNRREKLHKDLDLPVLVPASAKVDIDAYAAMPGAESADVKRWNAKVAEVELLRRNLGKLDDAEVPSYDARQGFENSINRLQELTGSGYAGEIDRWHGRLKEVDGQIAELKKRFEDAERQQQRPTLAWQKTVDPYLTRLGQLAGDQDPVHQRWTKAFAATETRSKELEKNLERVAQAPELTVAAADQLKELLNDYVQTTGLEPRQALEWRTRINAVNQERAQLAQSLGRLDGERTRIIDESLQAEADTALKRWRVLVGVDDPQVPVWQARIDASRVRTRTMRQRLAVLDDAQALRTQADLADLRVIYNEFRPLAASDDQTVQVWGRRLSAEETQVSSLKSSLARLTPDKPEALTRAEAVRLAKEFEQAQARLVLSADQQVVYATRLREEDRQFNELRQRLEKVNADNVKLYQGLIEDVERFGKMVGSDDAGFRKWSERITTYHKLYSSLKALNDPVAIPDRAQENLALFAAETEPGNGDVRRWTAKLNRVNELTSALEPLNQAAPIPEGAIANIASLVELVGDFTQARKWRDKIRQSDEIAARLHQRLDRTCLADPTLDQDYAILAGYIGETQPQMQRWKRHLKDLEPPQRPAWAMADNGDLKGFAADKHGHVAVLPMGGTSLRLRWVPAGSFVMGSPLNETGRDSDEAPVEVALTRGFWLAETETTQRQWQALMGGNPSDWRGDDHPVERISQADALAFCARLTATVSGLQARLPTEAEWEYACRAGSSKPFSSFQGDLDMSYAVTTGWMRGASDGHAPVAQRLPNRLGLYDLHGNVWEWCADRYGPYSPTEVTDPKGTTSASFVIRGGSWGDKPDRCRAGNRQQADAGLRSAYLGFRVVVAAAP